ncbi:MAG: thioredoxin family protein [Bacteroidetes bacterium]|nr:thioredoxin family protein [Bacteroidales bacterium]MBU1009853.1 thioredoxin family protein [Bacteroidota bacterium]
MEEKEPIVIEMYYTLSCPNCRVFKQLLKDVLPQFGNKFILRMSLANSPRGMIKTMKLGIYAVPALLIDNQIVFKSVPEKAQLIDILEKF